MNVEVEEEERMFEETNGFKREDENDADLEPLVIRTPKDIEAQSDAKVKEQVTDLYFRWSQHVLTGTRQLHQLQQETIESLSKDLNNAAQNNDQNAKRKWNIVQTGIMKALNALSRQSFPNPAEARSWYNDNKKNRDLWK